MKLSPHNSPYRFLLKVALLAFLPLSLFVAAYLCLDPYKVLRSYDDYFSDGLGVNKGVVSLHFYDAYNDSLRYDSFIVGSSLTCYFETDTWKKYLPADAVPFHFDSSGQTIPTSRLFLEYLDRTCHSMRNLLIVVNPDILRGHYRDDSLPGLIPPSFKGGVCYLVDFHYTFFRKISTYNYYASYIPWLISGKKEDLSQQHIFEPQPILHDRIKNEESIPDWNRIIETDSVSFYSIYPVRVPSDTCSYKVLGDILSPGVRKDCRAIAELIRKRSVNACIIVAPTLRLEVLSDENDRFLAETFGEAYVNLGREFRLELSDRKNFYDNTHFRPVLASKYLDRAYSIINARRNGQ